jgi:AAA domain
MPIICFEGPSAVGKTTTANAVKASSGAFVVPEVHELFTRPKDEPEDWYFDRQVDRWVMAREQTLANSLTILDGDPFQPLWYNWIYEFTGRQTPHSISRFYRRAIDSGRLEFPDLYVIFSAAESDLRNRRKRDLPRRRRNFEKHLQLIVPQRRYFEEMRTNSPQMVCFLNAASVDSNVEFVIEQARRITARKPGNSKILLDHMVRWLSDHKASDQSEK